MNCSHSSHSKKWNNEKSVLASPGIQGLCWSHAWRTFLCNYAHVLCNLKKVFVETFYFVVVIECLMNNLFEAYFIIHLFSLWISLKRVYVGKDVYHFHAKFFIFFSHFIAYNNFSLDVILTYINYPLLRSFHTIRKCLCCKIRILCYPGEVMEPVFIPTYSLNWECILSVHECGVNHNFLYRLFRV